MYFLTGYSSDNKLPFLPGISSVTREYSVNLPIKIMVKVL